PGQHGGPEGEQDRPGHDRLLKGLPDRLGEDDYGVCRRSSNLVSALAAAAVWSWTVPGSETPETAGARLRRLRTMNQPIEASATASTITRRSGILPALSSTAPSSAAWSDAPRMPLSSVVPAVTSSRTPTATVSAPPMSPVQVLLHRPMRTSRGRTSCLIAGGRPNSRASRSRGSATPAANTGTMSPPVSAVPDTAATVNTAPSKGPAQTPASP